MAQLVRDVMTPNPVTIPADAPVIEAARQMKEHDIGNVLVLDGDRVTGLVTDRDIVVRDIAEGRDPETTRIDEIASHDLEAVSPDDPVDKAVQIMRDRAVRRLPVLEGGRPVGIVSIGDLAISEDEGSGLADISSAPPNT